MTTDEQIAYIRDWAGKNRGYLELEGEVGFGRECVGIICGTAYPDWEKWDGDGEYEPADERVAPPAEAHDAYHKHPCLCILGRGPEAIAQLHAWVRKLDANGAVVVREERRPRDIFDMAFHGRERFYLAVPEVAA